MALACQLSAVSIQLSNRPTLDFGFKYSCFMIYPPLRTGLVLVIWFPMLYISSAV